MSTRETPEQKDKGDVQELELNKIQNYQILDNNIGSPALKRKIFKKCKEAVRRSTDFKEIGKYLVESLNNCKYEWSAFVCSQVSTQFYISNCVYKIKLKVRTSFAVVEILLISQYRQFDINSNPVLEAKSPSEEGAATDGRQNSTVIEVPDITNEVVLDPNQLPAISGGHYLPDQSVQSDVQSRGWQWPLDRIIKTIRNSLSSLRN